MTHTDFHGGKFVKMSDIVFELASTDPADKRMSVPWRIWELALGRMNNWGHAGFEKDELASLVTGKPMAGNSLGILRMLLAALSGSWLEVRQGSEGHGSYRSSVHVAVHRGAGMTS